MPKQIDVEPLFWALGVVISGVPLVIAFIDKLRSVAIKNANHECKEIRIRLAKGIRTVNSLLEDANRKNDTESIAYLVEVQQALSEVTV